MRAGALFFSIAMASLLAQPGWAQAAGETCPGGGRAIGVSRVVEIDAGSGPRYGQQQYKENDFLRDGEVVLTFDDGPLKPYTRPVLEALAAHCTKATFFMVGRMALADPEMVREVARRGHTVATHTFTHANLRSLAPQRAQGEIELGFSAVQRALGAPISPFFRFPYLADSQSMMAHMGARNIAMFSIDVDSIDFRTHDPQRMHRNVLASLLPKRKGILLFHDIQPSTARGIRGLLDDLAARGFKVVHLVPKAAVRTIPAWDQVAEGELAKRSRVLAADPNASRSVVWPIAQPRAPGERALPKSAVFPPMPPGRAPGVPASVADQPLPPPVVQQPQAAPAPQPPPILRDSASEDWHNRVFRN